MHPQMVTLFDFSSPTSEEDWRTTDDVVMGGISSSTLTVEPPEIGVFQGTVSLDRGGGFASVHAPLPSTNLSEYHGLEMRIRGDGNRYRLRLRTGASALTYQSPFGTQPGSWQSTRLPFQSFRPTFHGQVIADAPSLDTTEVTSLGWIIADRQAGQFRLEVDWVRAYVEETT